MNFVRIWLTGYYNPVMMIEQLRSKPAPYWGFYSQLVRAALDSFLLYLPVALMGRIPTPPSYLSFLPTGQYYWHLIWLSPIILCAEWLFSSAVIHLMLRLIGQRSDFDQILNISGMAALVVGAFLLVWDWMLFLLGIANPYFLGICHLVISLWAFVIWGIGLKRILGVPIWLGVLLSLLNIPVGIHPLALCSCGHPFELTWHVE